MVPHDEFRLVQAAPPGRRRASDEVYVAARKPVPVREGLVEAADRLEHTPAKGKVCTDQRARCDEHARTDVHPLRPGDSGYPGVLQVVKNHRAAHKSDFLGLVEAFPDAIDEVRGGVAVVVGERNDASGRRAPATVPRPRNTRHRLEDDCHWDAEGPTRLLEYSMRTVARAIVDDDHLPGAGALDGRDGREAGAQLLCAV